MSIFVLGIQAMEKTGIIFQCMVIVRQENLVVLRREKGMFEFRKKATLFADEFEVFNTPSMGLGVRVIEQDSQSAVFFRPFISPSCFARFFGGDS